MTDVPIGQPCGAGRPCPNEHPQCGNPSHCPLSTRLQPMVTKGQTSVVIDPVKR